MEGAPFQGGEMLCNMGTLHLQRIRHAWPEGDVSQYLQVVGRQAETSVGVQVELMHCLSKHRHCHISDNDFRGTLRPSHSTD